MPRKPRAADWWVLDIPHQPGWRGVYMDTFGPKWVRVRTVTGKLVIMRRHEWADLLKRPIVNKVALTEEQGYHDLASWKNQKTGKQIDAERKEAGKLRRIARSQQGQQPPAEETEEDAA